MEIGENFSWKIKKRKTGNFGKEKSGKLEIMKKEYRENGYLEKEKLGKKGICKNAKWKKEKLARAETWKIRNL